MLAKAGGITITGCGYQDIFWGGLVSNLAASTHKITKIKGSSSYNVETTALIPVASPFLIVISNV